MSNQRLKYHVEIPEEWLLRKYPGWNRQFADTKNYILKNEAQRFHETLVVQKDPVLFTANSEEFKDWGITVINPQYQQERELIESIGSILRDRKEILIHTDSDLGAEILELTGKEALHG